MTFLKKYEYDRVAEFGESLASLMQEWEQNEEHKLKGRFRYLNEAFRLRCLPDLWGAGVYPDLKELSESMAAFEAVRNNLKDFSIKDKSITAVVVGDGSTPRTGVMFALRTAWQVHSVDPLLTEQNWSVPLQTRIAIQNLFVHQNKAQEISFPEITGKVVILQVHSHAAFEDAVNIVPNAAKIAAVVIPCCVKSAMPKKEYTRRYTDYGILSAMRNVYIFNSI